MAVNCCCSLLDTCQNALNFSFRHVKDSKVPFATLAPPEFIDQEHESEIAPEPQGDCALDGLEQLESNPSESLNGSKPFGLNPLECEEEEEEEEECEECSYSYWNGEACGSDSPRKLFTKDEKAHDKLVGVVLTISDGACYDEMFREVRPATVPGERVGTYALSCYDVKKLHDFLASSAPVPDDQLIWKSIVDDIRAVSPDSVTLNWECCSGCGDHPFPGHVGGARGRASWGRLWRSQRQANSSDTMQLMGLALRRGHTVMCSDFSLKSLIHEWSEEHLGPNPFIKVGGCSDQFTLEFLPSELRNEEVPQQLQVVGELCSAEGKAVVKAMGDTIVYTVNPRRATTGVYDLKILTVVTGVHRDDLDTQSRQASECSIGEGTTLRKGWAGHVTLTYQSGGQLVTSMGHWIELARLDTSVDAFEHMAEHNFGAEELSHFREDYAAQVTDSAQYECVQKWAKSSIQKSVPTRMKCRTKY